MWGLFGSSGAEKTRVLMVCMGNVCRSPIAMSVTQHLLAQAGLQRRFEVDSAGTHADHIGEPPDPRARVLLAERGYPVTMTRSRRIDSRDFAQCELVVAMDQSNLDNLREACPPEHVHKLRLLLEFAPEAGVRDVPDPYYGGAAGFARVLELCEAGARGLVTQLQSRSR